MAPCCQDQVRGDRHPAKPAGVLKVDRADGGVVVGGGDLDVEVHALGEQVAARTSQEGMS